MERFAMSDDADLSRKLDEALENTFPASDPVAIGCATSTEPPRSPVDRTWNADADALNNRDGPGTAEPLRSENKIALVGIAVVAGCLIAALSFMLGETGTQNDASNRGPSGAAQSQAESPPAPNNTPSR
jgi:hypothetical protein